MVVKEDSVITLSFLDGILEKNELNNKKKELKRSGFDLIENDTSGVFMNSLEEYASQIILGLGTSFAYEALKNIIIWIWNNTKDKTFYKITSKETTKKPATFAIRFNYPEGGSVDFKLEGNISDSEKSKIIKEAFELANSFQTSKNNSEILYAKYDYQSNYWNPKTLNEIAREEWTKQKNKI